MLSNRGSWRASHGWRRGGRSSGNHGEQHAHNLVERILLPAAENSHLDKLEAEDLEYIEDPRKENSGIIGDTIIVGTKASVPEGIALSIDPNDHGSTSEEKSGEVDTVLRKGEGSDGT